MKKQGSTFVLVITVLIFAVAMTLAALAVFMRSTGRVVVKAEPGNSEAETDIAYEKFAEIDKYMQETFLGDYDRDALMDDTFRAMLEGAGDEYTRYLSEEELAQLQQGINSVFTGTGILVIKNEEGEGFLVTDVIDGGPAAAVGLKEGDIIIAADGKTPNTVEEMMEILKGDGGTQVKLNVLRDGDEMEFSVIRGDVHGASADSQTLEGEIGYIRIRSFGEDTYGIFDSALSGFEGKNTKGVIIDLRNNPGGLFDEGVKIADRILPECLVTYTVDKEGNKENYNSDSKKTGLKIVCLVNENTGSTGEMLAQSLKTNGNVQIIGATTYGKGLIQESHVFNDNTAVSITVKEFFGPDGYKINGVGVEPNVKVPMSQTSVKDTQLERALALIKSAV